MSYQGEEAIFDRILRLLEAQRRLLEAKLSREDHGTFTQQSLEIRELIGQLSRHEPAGRP